MESLWSSQQAAVRHNELITRITFFRGRHRTMKFCRGHGGKVFHVPAGNIPGVGHGGAHLKGGRLVLGVCLDLLILRKISYLS